MVNIPAAFQPLVAQMSQATGIPQAVIGAQANMESGFNANAVSPAGAEGWLQFLPSTYDAVAAQAGVAPGTEFNPTDESKAYDVYMNQLLSQEGGSVFKALEAYNAGPNNLGAGAGYANSILSAAGTGTNITAGGGSTGGGSTGTTLTSFTDPFPFGKFDPLNWPFELGGAAANAVQSTLSSTLKKIEADLWAKFKPLAIRFGLIVLGAVIVYAGINGLLKGESAGPTQIGVKAAKKVAE